MEKPDRLKHVLKAGKIPTDAEVIAAIDTLITGYLNCEPYGGSVEEDRGMRRIDVHRARCPVVRKADKEDLRLMLMRTSKPVTVDRDGVRIQIKGIKIDFTTRTLYGSCKANRCMCGLTRTTSVVCAHMIWMTGFMQTATKRIDCRVPCDTRANCRAAGGQTPRRACNRRVCRST